MKILFDPVYTQRPRVCSTSYLVWELIERLSSARADLFFYVLYPPDKMQPEDWEFCQRFSDRVTLLPLEQSTQDRLAELMMLRNSLRFYLNPWNLDCWDVDVVVSSRIPMLKYYPLHSARQGSRKLPSHRYFVGLEEMPLLPFRDTVPWSDWMYPDQLVSYGLTDATLVNHQWMAQSLKPALREVFSVAWQKRILEKLHEVVPVKLERFKTEKTYTDGDFNVTFVGRITSTRNFQAALDVFRDQFAFPLGKNKQKMRFLISTNSQTVTGEYNDWDFIDLQMNDRPKFYEFLKQAHVAVNMTTVEDFSLSTYETLKAGVPIIVGTYPWNEFLGSSYPFRVKNETEAYAMLNAFAANYTAMYEKFKSWESSWWDFYVNRSGLNVTTSERLLELLGKFESWRSEKLGEGGYYLEHLSKVPVVNGKIDMNAYLKENGKMFERGKIKEEFSLPLGRYPNTLLFKLVAQRHGWKETNQCGVMTK